MAVSSQTTQILDNFLPQYHSPPTQFTGYAISVEVKARYPKHQHIILREQAPLEEYLKSQGVEYRVSERLTVHTFDTPKLISNVHIGVDEFSWKGTLFLLYKFKWPVPFRPDATLNILVFLGEGNTKEEKDSLGTELLTAAFKWDQDTREEIWVFSDETWVKDKKLYQAISQVKWDDLVLDKSFVDGLKRDTETFFSSKEIYHSLGITWKRGLLLLGPPGNGKTESIKVLLKETDIPALYVKSFTTCRGAEAGIREIFEFARSQAPCILVLEDLDSMVKPEVRAFFLNELDGLEQNEGILTIATSNHPEKIDSAILNRPSRFDVKYTFNLPTRELRKQYVQAWTKKAKQLSGIEFSDSFMDKIADNTDGFSFAFMKELFVSFLLRVAHDKAAQKAIDTEKLMRAQVKELKVQIEIGKNVGAESASNETPQEPNPMVAARFYKQDARW